MQKILLSLLTVGLAASVAIGATRAYFSDTETSTGNSFTAGTLDLNLDGGNVNVQKFNVSNVKPGYNETGIWLVNNVGNVDGYLDLHSIAQTHLGGTSTDAELAVDPGNLGNLGTLLNATLFVDENTNNVYDAGTDTLIYSGALGSMAANYDQNIALAASATKSVALTVDWPTTNPDTTDNAGQGDTAQLDLTFELGQTTGQ